MKLCDFPLVSVPVITYNSSKTVLETLDSIYNQTYQNLELIVSDDCSTDNTVDICREWIEAHKERFVRTELLTVKKNTGVSANMNRAEKACQGEWVKAIAGDDLLLHNCIQVYVEHVSAFPETIYLFSRLSTFRGDGNNRHSIDNMINYDFFLWPIEEQYHFLIFNQNHVPAPTSFYNRKRIEQLGVTNDERIPLVEDWPRWVNLLKKNVRFSFINEELVMYRVSEQSISNSSKTSLSYSKSLSLFFIYYQFKEFYRAGERKYAIKRYIQAKRYIRNNLFWRGLNRISKKLI